MYGHLVDILGPYSAVGLLLKRARELQHEHLLIWHIVPCYEM